MILVSGYYGFGNLGDEAILAALCEDLARLGIERGKIVVLSADPAATKKEHGTLSLPRYSFFQIRRALGSARLFISGGGSLLQDITSKRSLPYYLGLAELAFYKKVPVAFYAHGLGPLASGPYRRWVAWAFARSAGFTVRDESSANFLRSLGVAVAPSCISADPVYKWGGRGSGAKQANTVLLNLRPYAGWPKERLLWLEFIQKMRAAGLRPEFIPLGPGDFEIGKSLQAGVADLPIQPILNLQNYREVFSRAKLSVSMRLHGVIFSAICGVLPIGLNYDPKVVAACRQLGIICCEPGSLADVKEAVAASWGEYGERRRALRKALAKLAALTSLNRQMLASALKLE